MLKKFLIGTFVALALMVTSVASAAYDFGPSTLRVGSKGVYVSTLQTFVGAISDGSFGPMTKAKVVAWQASNGLVADGLFGNLSKAKANSTASVFPAGCTNASGFSTITGTSCASLNANTFSPAGCTSASGFSPVTGGACVAVNANTLPAGCVTGAAFSATTGASCTGAVVVTNNGPLVGGAGDISFAATSTDVVDLVAEGQTEKVLGFKVQATGSDVALKNLKVTLNNTDAHITAGGSYRLSDYASTVEVYMGSTLVGSANVADFTKDVHDYSTSIALSNAVVREGSNNKATFYVVVKANSTIDSTDIAQNTWTAVVSNIRFQDATGVIMSNTPTGTEEGYLTSAFDFTDLAGLGDVKLTISKGTSSPIIGNVEVSSTNTTADVLMLEFKLKAGASVMTFDTLKVDLANSGDSALTNMIGELTLKNGSTVLATESTIVGNNAVTFDLGDTFTIAKDATETFRVYAKINRVCVSTACTSAAGANFTAGDSLTVSLATTGIAAEDSNGDVVTVEAGAAAGTAQTFRINGAAVTYVSDTYTAYDNSASSEGTIAMKFTVTAFGDNEVVINTDQHGENVAAGSAGQGIINYTIDGATASGSVVTSSTATAVNSVFTVAAGSTETFTLSAKVGLSSGFVIMHVNSVDGTSVTNIQTSAH